MKKLTQLLKESQELDYRRMNVGEEDGQGMTKEEKRAFVEAVAAYRQLGEMISHKGNLAEIHDSIKGIVENANNITLKETGDWFDRVTVQRHMKSMNESFKVFSNTIKEVSTLQQRLESSYDEIGEVLGKYYEIKEGNEFGAERAKAIAAGDDSFEVDGKEFKVTGVDSEDKKNAEEFANESMKLGSLLKREELKGDQHKIDVDGDGEIEASDLAALRAKKKDESVTEGKKVFKVNPQIGKAKYSISSHDGVKKHKDGSDFFDIETFKNKVDLEKAIKNYTSKGFKMESVNEAFSDNKNLNALMKGRKITNVAYDSNLGFAVILDNGKYIQFDAHSARPGQSKDMEFESVNEEKYPIAVEKFNQELIKHPMVKKAAQHYKKSPADIVKVLQQRLYTKGDKSGNTKEVYIDFKDTDSGIVIKHKMKFNESVESVNEISLAQGLKDLAKGTTSSVEGVKVSRTLANAILNWTMSSPWGMKYGKQMLKAPFGASWKMILSSSFGVEAYLKRWDKQQLAKVKPELEAIKSKLGI